MFMRVRFRSSPIEQPPMDVVQGLAPATLSFVSEVGRFDEGLALLVDHTERDGEALALRLQRAKLKPNTAAKDTDDRHARGLDKALFQRMLGGHWLADKQNGLLTGPTGMGKTWLGCALAHQACRRGTARTTSACRACSTN